MPSRVAALVPGFKTRVGRYDPASLDGIGVNRFNTLPPSDGQVAQLVEQRTENPRVGSSTLPLATILINNLANSSVFPRFPCVKFARISLQSSAHIRCIVAPPIAPQSLTIFS